MTHSRRTPLDPDLYAEVVEEARSIFEVWPSAYASGWVVKTYRDRGGRYAGESPSRYTGLVKWFGEEWVDLSRPVYDEDGDLVGYEPCGREYATEQTETRDYPKCRPIAEALAMTPAEVRAAVKRKRAAEAKAHPKGRGRPPVRVATYRQNPPEVRPGGYAAVVLDADSSDRLIVWWLEHVGLPLHAVVHAHHMTLKFKPSADDLEQLPLEQPVTLWVTGWAADDKGQAVVVDTPLASANATPHVTVSVAEGVKPAYSNDLLRGYVIPVLGPQLHGMVRYVVSGGEARRPRTNPTQTYDLRGDDRLPFLDAVWSMYRKSYEKIGLIVGSGQELLVEYDVWEVTLNDLNEPVAFCLFKATPYGLKVGLSGSDGSPEGRSVARASFATKYQRDGVYGEVSHRPAEIAKEAGVPVVCANVASVVLRKNIELLDDIHYVRSLANVGPVKKMLVGRPVGVPTTDIDAPVCPAVRMNPSEPTADDLADFDAHYASVLFE